MKSSASASSVDQHVTITVVAVFALLCCAALAWSYREARLAVLLFIGLTAFLLVTPTWFPHYAGFTAAPVALVVGAAIGRIIALVRARPAQIAVGVVTAGALAGLRERLVRHHLRPPVPQQLQEFHRLRTGLRDRRRRDNAGRFRHPEPQPEPGTASSSPISAETLTTWQPLPDWRCRVTATRLSSALRSTICELVR